jgi:predicted anti-sigma-YlaC factor YlaD
MRADDHAIMRDVIDKTLAGSVLPEEEQSLREHLSACAECQEYLDAGTRALAGLGGFSFEVNPGLQAKVLASLKVRAEQLEAAQPSRRRMVWGCIGAVVLLVMGSAVASQFGNLAAGLLHLQPMQVQRVLIAVWVVPSLCFALLFPLLPLLRNRKESVL